MMTALGPNSLRALIDRLTYCPGDNGGDPDRSEGLAHADAWEADNYAHAVEVAAKDVVIAALRERLEAEVKLQIEFRKGLLEQNGLVLTLNKRLEEAEKAWEELKTDRLGIPTAESIMRLHAALASQPEDVVPHSDDIRTSHDTTASATADQRDKGPCWAGGNIAGD